MPSPLLVFGLGNPGREYEHTYHNTGLLALRAVENIATGGSSGAGGSAEKHFRYHKHGGVIIAQTAPDAELYMNQSGTPVQEALAYFKIPSDHLVVLHDDSDLQLGDWKLEYGRGAAGHHGVESVIAALGTKNFWRGRIGIRPPEPEDRRRKAEEFVLKTISSEDDLILVKTLEALGEAVLKLQFPTKVMENE